MNIFMIGGTGLLGCEAATQLIKMGHKVTSVALPPLPQGAPIPEEMKIVFGDINKKSDEEIEEMLKGNDVFIYAAGVDERVEFPHPVMDYYDKFNNAPLRRIFPLCKKVGVKRAVVLGSYFAYLTKSRPDMGLQQRNPYFKARMMQEDICKNAVDDNFSTCVLELPYIFGTQPGRKPVWTILIEQLKMMDKLPFTLYPKGGTAMLTVRQVGEAIVGAAEQVKGARAYGISCYNLTWREFLKIVYRAMDGIPDRKIVDCPKVFFQLFGHVMRKDYASRNVEGGIDPVGLADIMGMELFIPTDDTKELGCTPDDIEAAIFDSIKLSKDAYEGKAKLLGMKGE